MFFFFFFSSRRRHTRLQGDWSSDVCSSDLHNLKSERVPKTRQKAGGRPVSSGEAGMNGAGFSAIARVRLCGAPPTPTGARLRPFRCDGRVLAAVSVVGRDGRGLHRGHDLGRGGGRLLGPLPVAAGALPAAARLLLGAGGLLLGPGRLLLRRLPSPLGGAAGLPLAQQL